MTEPCVLITAREGHYSPTPQSQSHGEGEGGHFSGSGFIIDAQQGLVATSASWMGDLLQLDTPKLIDNTTVRPMRFGREKMQCDPGLNWRLAPNKSVIFHILIQECHPKQQIPGKEVVCREAQLHGVYLMPSVYACLKEQLSSLAQWRSPSETTSSSQTSLGPVILPLSSLPLRYSNHIPTLGDQISLLGTPFGSFCPEVFLGSVSVGCVSKVLGREGKVFVSDARCLPGCEGAMVLYGGHSSLVVVGMVLTPFFTQKGSPAGLSLACSISAVMDAVKSHDPPLTAIHSTPNIRGSPALKNEALNVASVGGTGEDYNIFVKVSEATISVMGYAPPSAISKITVAVVTGGNWGSGILVSPRMVLTCGHVVQESKRPVVVRLPAPHDPREFPSNIVISTTTPDIALLQLTQPVSDPRTLALVQNTFGSLQHVNATHHSDSIVKGNPVFTVGYGLQQPMKSMSPLVTRGIISAVSRWRGEPIMFMTTAVVHSGMSGGVVVCATTGRPLGIIVGNSEDPETGCVYPDVNYCVPLTWILPPILRFRATGDFSELKRLLNCSEEIVDIWKLKTKDRTLQSKL